MCTVANFYSTKIESYKNHLNKSYIGSKYEYTFLSKWEPFYNVGIRLFACAQKLDCACRKIVLYFYSSFLCKSLHAFYVNHFYVSYGHFSKLTNFIFFRLHRCKLVNIFILKIKSQSYFVIFQIMYASLIPHLFFLIIKYKIMLV